MKSMKNELKNINLIEKAVIVRAKQEKHLSFFKEQITGLISNVTWFEINFLNLFDNNHKTFVVEIDSEPVSFCSFIVADNIADIDATATKKDFQNLGLASLCFETALPELKNEGIDKIFLEVAENNLTARKFYEKMGFVLQEKRLKFYYNDGQDALVYCLNL